MTTKQTYPILSEIKESIEWNDGSGDKLYITYDIHELILCHLCGKKYTAFISADTNRTGKARITKIDKIIFLPDTVKITNALSGHIKEIKIQKGTSLAHIEYYCVQKSTKS
jgi:hypothetical protein